MGLVGATSWHDAEDEEVQFACLASRIEELLQVGVPIQSLDMVVWESFKVLLAHLCGKERGSQKCLEFDGASIKHEFMGIKRAVHEVVDHSRVLDSVYVWVFCGGGLTPPFSPR
eukprot:759181-Pelagomonas_calceolata.AAC.3